MASAMRWPRVSAVCSGISARRWRRSRCCSSACPGCSISAGAILLHGPTARSASAYRAASPNATRKRAVIAAPTTVCRRTFHRPPIRWHPKPTDVMRGPRSGGRRHADATRRRALRRQPRARTRRRVVQARAGALGRQRRAARRRRPSRCCALAPRRHRRGMYRCKRNHLTRTKLRGCRPSRSRRLAGCATPGRARLRRQRVRWRDRVYPAPRLATAHCRLDVVRQASSGRWDRRGALRDWLQARASLLRVLRVLRARRVLRAPRVLREQLRRLRQRK